MGNVERAKPRKPGSLTIPIRTATGTSRRLPAKKGRRRPSRNGKSGCGRGVHTAPSKSITVAKAAKDWVAYVELEGRERSTVVQYRQHADRHIRPRHRP